MFELTVLALINLVGLIFVSAKISKLRHDIDLHRMELRQNRKRLIAAGIDIDIHEGTDSSARRPESVQRDFHAKDLSEGSVSSGIDSPDSPIETPAPYLPETDTSQTESQAHPVTSESSNSRGFVFETLFGRTLPIWAGGLTLAITGILGVKWSIDAGLLSEGVRVFLGILFGLALISGAFWQKSGNDSRIPQALCGAGIASLYGAVLSAHILYDLIGPGAAMFGMVIVTLAGGLLSMLFGSPMALLALAGGLAAPALIGGEGNVPLLACYIAAVSAGGAFLARLQDRIWLATAALAGGLLWAGVLLLMAGDSFNASFVILLILFAGFAIPVIGIGSRSGGHTKTTLIGATLATVQCAGLVILGGFGIVQWTGLLLATLASLALAQRRSLANLPMIAGGIAFLAILAYRENDPAVIVLSATPFLLVHVIHAIWRVVTLSTRIDAIRLLATPTSLSIVFFAHGGLFSDVMLGILLFGCAAFLVGTIEWLRMRDIAIAKENEVGRFIAVITAALGILLVGDLPFFPVAFALLAAAAITASGWHRAGFLAFGIACLSALSGINIWLASGASSLAGVPFYVSAMPTAGEIFRSMIPLSLLSVFAVWRLHDRLQKRVLPFVAIAGFSALVMIHFAWKHLFGIATPLAFVQSGMAERTLWELGLALAALGAWRISKPTGVTLGAMSLLHFFVFSLILHNPLWAEQNVGPAPVTNLVGLSFVTTFGLLFAAGRIGMNMAFERPRRIIQMVLIAAAGFMLLRQAFLGSVMIDDSVSQLEDILRSLVAIAIALGLLVYGIRTRQIDWRIGSLILMLGAVGKVFIFDAAGLDGIARIGSFAALGFALIGVGWIYAKLLPERNSA